MDPNGFLIISQNVLSCDAVVVDRKKLNVGSKISLFLESKTSSQLEILCMCSVYIRLITHFPKSMVGCYVSEFPVEIRTYVSGEMTEYY